MEEKLKRNKAEFLSGWNYITLSQRSSVSANSVSGHGEFSCIF